MDLELKGLIEMVVSTHFCDAMGFVNVLSLFIYLDEIQRHISACQPEGPGNACILGLKIRIESQSIFFKMNYLLFYFLYCILYYCIACPLGIMKV